MLVLLLATRLPTFLVSCITMGIICYLYVCACKLSCQCEIDSYRLVYAFDRDPKRYEILGDMVTRGGASNVILQLADFLTVGPCMCK